MHDRPEAHYIGETTTEEFNRIYRPHMAAPVRQENPGRAGRIEMGGNSGRGSERVAFINQSACAQRFEG